MKANENGPRYSLPNWTKQWLCPPRCPERQFLAGNQMITRIDGLPTGVFGFEVREPATQDEFDDVANAFDATISESYEIALLMDVHPDVKSLLVIEKSQFENRLAARGRVRRFAVVGGGALRNDFGGFTEFVGCDLRLFPSGARNAALEWLLGEPFPRDRDGLA